MDDARLKNAPESQTTILIASLQKIIRRFNGPPESWWTEEELRWVASLEGFEDVTRLKDLAKSELEPEEIDEARTRFARGIWRAVLYREAMARGAPFPEKTLGGREDGHFTLDEAKEALRICVKDGIIAESIARSMSLAELAETLECKIPEGSFEGNMPAFTGLTTLLPKIEDLVSHADAVCGMSAALGLRWGEFKRAMIEKCQARSVVALREIFLVPEWLHAEITEEIVIYAITGDPKILKRQIGGLDHPVPLYIPCARGNDQKLVNFDIGRSTEFFGWSILELQEKAAKNNSTAKRFLKVISDPATFDEKLGEFLAAWKERCRKIGNVTPGRLLKHTRQLLGPTTDYQKLRDFMFVVKPSTGELFVGPDQVHKYTLANEATLRRAFRDAFGRMPD
ncbi:MAG: hypothetical protein KF712_21085 [Akkermansiaceae bacterium]|nr:hypothetical protein [Akkermansiaceae bacterium]